MTSNEKRGVHDRLQSQYFNEHAGIFVQPIPESIQDKTRKIAASAGLSSADKVMDVGTGAGVLIGHFLEFGLPCQNIAGVDLSEMMLKNARSRYPDVFFWQGNILDIPDDLRSAGFPPNLRRFDAVVFNACFGNIFDQSEALSKAKSVLMPAGRILISHPLGAIFVAQLRAHEPDIVPHLLPAREQLEQWASGLGMSLTHFQDDKDFYLTILEVAATQGAPGT